MRFILYRLSCTLWERYIFETDESCNARLLIVLHSINDSNLDLVVIKNNQLNY